MPRLTNPQYETFARKFVETPNATQVFQQVYPERVKDIEQVRRSAAKIMARKEVRDRIGELQDQAARRACISREETLAALSRVVRSRPGALLDEKGQVILEKLQKTGQEVAGIHIKTSYDDRGMTQDIKIQHRDMIAAAALIAKLQGWERPMQIDLNAQVQMIALADIRTNANEIPVHGTVIDDAGDQ